IDNATKEDKTEVTLALIISEELKSQPRSVPLGTLRDLIHQRSEKLLSQLREGPIGRLIPASVGGVAPAGSGATEGGDGKVRADASAGGPKVGDAPTAEAITANQAGFLALRDEVARLVRRVAALEAQLGERTAKGDGREGA